MGVVGVGVDAVVKFGDVATFERAAKIQKGACALRNGHPKNRFFFTIIFNGLDNKGVIVAPFFVPSFLCQAMHKIR